MSNESTPTPIDPSDVELFAQLAIDGVERETPHHLERAPQWKGKFVDRTPREITPAFYGCFDWHSAVHSHWSLVRMMRCCPSAKWESAATKIIGRHLTRDHIAQEIDYFIQPGMENFERPYGLAWLLQLAAELAAADLPDAARWRDALRPLEELARQRFLDWLPNLPAPDRSGMHSQTAFAMGLLWDVATELRDSQLQSETCAAALRFFGSDRGVDIACEPDIYDFLSPTLAVADLMRRVLPGAAFANWLREYYPELNEETDVEHWLRPVASCDPADGLSCHLDGLNTSRAWMLEGIAHGLPHGDERRPLLLQCADRHRAAGLAAIYPQHYSGAHWLGTFAVYLITGRGCAGATPI